jgi:hypothetical protein
MDDNKSLNYYSSPTHNALTAVAAASFGMSLFFGYRIISSIAKGLRHDMPKIKMIVTLETALEEFLPASTVKGISKLCEKLYDFYLYQYKNMILEGVDGDIEDKVHSIMEYIARMFLNPIRLFSSMSDNEMHIIDTVDRQVLFPLFKLKFYEIENHHKYNNLSRTIIFNILNL